MTTRLALFDLDKTLLDGDSDHAWGEFVVAKGLVDADSHRKTNDAFYQQYLTQELDTHTYVRFTLQSILTLDEEQRAALHREYMQRFVEPMILDAGLALIEEHRRAGDFCLLITATNSFFAGPTAKRLGMDDMLATDLKIENGRLTGEVSGIPCYQEGKVTKLRQWLQHHDYDLSKACFYTDSINDLPLLQQVGEPIAVDPDAQLEEIAIERNWPIISLRG